MSNAVVHYEAWMQRTGWSTPSLDRNRRLECDMLIYLDANIVQYCADYQEFLFGGQPLRAGIRPQIASELRALRDLVEREQLGSWEFVVSEHLLEELRRGQPTIEQRDTCNLLENSAESVDAGDTYRFAQQLSTMNFTDDADRRHVGIALALGVSWFITNDRNIVEATGGRVDFMRVARPSECLEEISAGLFLAK